MPSIRAKSGDQVPYSANLRLLALFNLDRHFARLIPLAILRGWPSTVFRVIRYIILTLTKLQLNLVLITSLLLCPIMWYVWADSMAGNANFYFATTLAVIIGRKVLNLQVQKNPCNFDFVLFLLEIQESSFGSKIFLFGDLLFGLLTVIENFL